MIDPKMLACVSVRVTVEVFGDHRQLSKRSGLSVLVDKKPDTITMQELVLTIERAESTASTMAISDLVLKPLDQIPVLPRAGKQFEPERVEPPGESTGRH